MKVPLVMLLFAATAIAQNAPSIPPACGADGVKFNVKTDKAQHPSVQPENGKAVVYFVQDDDSFEAHPRPTTRLGLDGSWVGANHGDSYFYISVDPGEHHLCASPQSMLIGLSEPSAAHFTAESGKSYYFQVRNSWSRDQGGMRVELLPLDSDEGQFLASRFAFSTSQPKN